MRIWLVRHGQSSMSGLYTGKRTDPGLSPHGGKQAERLARRFEAERIDRLCASPLRRARETAGPISGICSRPVEIVDGMAELDFGLWDGLSHEEINRESPRYYSDWLANPEIVAPPEGETLLIMAKRVLESFEEIRRSSGSGNAVVVAHGGPIGVILCDVLGLPLDRRWQLKIDTASITTVDWVGDHPPVLIRLNEEV